MVMYVGGDCKSLFLVMDPHYEDLVGSVLNVFGRCFIHMPRRCLRKMLSTDPKIAHLSICGTILKEFSEPLERRLYSRYGTRREVNDSLEVRPEED